MDFNDSPQEAAFRAQVRQWLVTSAAARDADGQAQLTVEQARKWQARKAAAGYAAITWPVQFGGRGGSEIEAVIYAQEEARAGLTSKHFAIGLGQCVPTVMVYGDAQQRERYIKPALYGDEIWCQLFSEPAAGSDLAAVKTCADRDGDTWIVNGQKCWTSGAEYSDFGLLLARSDRDASKHGGLTMLLLDMKSPGVEIRPIRQADGGSEFSEVFLTDVRIADRNRLGQAGAGWEVALTTLMHERNAVGGLRLWLTPDEVAHLAEHLSGTEAVDNPALCDRIADWMVADRGLAYTHYRAMTALSRGKAPGPEQAIHKLVRSAQAQQMAYFLMDLPGLAGARTTNDLGDAWQQVQSMWWWGAALRIAGGSDEILKNILAERVLGLPRESRTERRLARRPARLRADLRRSTDER